MKRYRLTAELLSPLTIGRDRHSERAGPAASVSGSLVRGAAAARYLQLGGAPSDADFITLFLNDQACRWGPLDADEEILPLTALSCKRQPGFLSSDRDRVADRPTRMPLGVSGKNAGDADRT